MNSYSLPNSHLTQKASLGHPIKIDHTANRIDQAQIKLDHALHRLIMTNHMLHHLIM